MMADGVYKVGRTSQDYGTHLKRLKAYPGDSVISMVLKAFMREWDGGRVRFTTMFQNLRTRFPDVFFKYPHLVDALRARGYIVDNAGFVTKIQNL